MNNTKAAVARDVVMRRPGLRDAASIWRLARESKVLDVNSSYAYALWCRDFADSSVVATANGAVVGFVTGFVRPSAPDTVFVWQVAVDAHYRGAGVGVAMLDSLLGSIAARHVWRLETTVSADNAASVAMFAALARRRGAQLTRRPLFGADDFPDDHAAEDLYLIEPDQQRQDNE